MSLPLLTLFYVVMECTKFIGKIYFSDEEATTKLEKIVFYVGWSQRLRTVFIRIILCRKRIIFITLSITS